SGQIFRRLLRMHDRPNKYRPQCRDQTFLSVQAFLLVFTEGSGGDYRRTMSRKVRWLAHASRVLASDFSTLAETRANQEKFAMARTPSPARETRALPNPLETERT